MSSFLRVSNNLVPPFRVAVVRGRWLRMLLFAGLVCGTVPSVVEAAGGGSGVQVTLQTRLEKTLRARRPNEKQFITLVVAQVEQGQLPRSLVDSAFNWARKKPSQKVQYFEQALRLLARKRGLRLATGRVTSLR